MNKPEISLSPEGAATAADPSFIPPISWKGDAVIPDNDAAATGPRVSASGADSRVSASGNVAAAQAAPGEPGSLPDYLVKTYNWAYVKPRNVELLDRGVVVETILWGNGRYLMDWAFCEFAPGQEIMQPASVYGPFSRRLAEVVGPDGYLEIRDIQSVQIEHTRPKVAGLKQVSLKVADAAEPVGREFDGVCCFFLLHEVPDDYKRRIVDSLLESVRPGGKVVFVDYHRPSNLHPLKLIMLAVNRFLEPYTDSIWKRDIKTFSSRADDFVWTKATCFGGLYQKVVAVKKA